MRLVFSILHYKTEEVTIECIESIHRLNTFGNDVYIIVVDNASNDGSGESIEERYSNDDRLKVIKNKENLGFAKGNNIGYEYAKNVLNADVTLIINNDTVIEQDNFIDILVHVLQEKSDCSIIAPNVINKQGVHQNPVRYSHISFGEILFVLFYNIFIFISMYIPFINSLILKMLEKKHKKDEENINYNISQGEYIENIVPHGSAIIFTKEYIKKEEMAFNPRTFLYCEEDLLYEHAVLNGLKTLYSSKLIIRHMEDVSTNAINKDIVKRKVFIAKNKIKSAWILLKYRYKKDPSW